MPKAVKVLRARLASLPSDASDVDRGQLLTAVASALLVTDTTESPRRIAAEAVELLRDGPAKLLARALFVHPNTVRYRLRRISQVIGWDATGAREALILQSALILGSMSDPDGAVRRRPTRK